METFTSVSLLCSFYQRYPFSLVGKVMMTVIMIYTVGGVHTASLFFFYFFFTHFSFR